MSCDIETSRTSDWAARQVTPAAEVADPSEHKGCCGHCGSTVRKGFTVCTGCGAEWKRVASGDRAVCGVLIILSAFLVAPLVGIAAREGGVGLLAALILTVTGLVVANSGQVYRWMRRS